jgi:tyrosyl-tRNA synthetase
MAAKKQLGKDIAGFYYGPDAAAAAEAEWTSRFSIGNDPKEIPEIVVPPDQLQDGEIGIADLLVALKLATSKKDARRHVEAGAVTTGPEKTKLTDPFAKVQVQDGQIFRIGSRRVVKVKRA